MCLTNIYCWTLLTKSSQALIFISHVPRPCKLPNCFPWGFPSRSLIPSSIHYQFLAFLPSSSPKLCFLSGFFTISFPALLSWRVPFWSFDFCNSYVSLGTSNTILQCFDFLNQSPYAKFWFTSGFLEEFQGVVHLQAASYQVPCLAGEVPSKCQCVILA